MRAALSLAALLAIASAPAWAAEPAAGQPTPQ